MLMSKIVVFILLLSILSGTLTGNLDNVSAAAVSGTASAVTLLISICGAICFWSGIMQVMKKSGLADKIAGFLKPFIRRLFKSYAEDEEVIRSLSQNMAANLLGLGNAATPAGLRGAKRLSELAEKKGERPWAVHLLIVMNTASIQLIPTTIAAVRAEAGAAAPFDIIPAVWIASAASFAVAIACIKLMEK